MAVTYEPIANYTVATPAASYTFNTLGAYTDIILVINGATTTPGQDMLITVNGDNGNNYSRTYVYGTGTTYPSGRDASQPYFAVGGAHANSHTRIHFMNYANTTTYKTFIARNDPPGNFTLENVGIWRSTAAITSITITTQTYNMATGSTFAIYGIKAA